jgi:hypothetical protein
MSARGIAGAQIGRLWRLLKALVAPVALERCPRCGMGAMRPRRRDGAAQCRRCGFLRRELRRVV